MIADFDFFFHFTTRWSFIYHVTDFCDAAFKLLAHDGLTDGCHKAAQRVLVGFGRLVAAHDEKGESADKVERCVAKLAGKLEKVLVKPTGGCFLCIFKNKIIKVI